ncbi:MAG: hypothetical protein JO340_14140 [Acidobacteriaceae bacterium]|nr:hypothetical protein [Acidobacteriaceae bacterium]
MDDEALTTKFRSLEKYGVERVKHDLLSGAMQLVGGTREHREEVWEWVRMKERLAQAVAIEPEPELTLL